MVHNTHMALATSPRRKVISISADMLLNFELSPDCLNSAKSFGKSASTSVAAIDAGRPCRTLTRLRKKSVSQSSSYCSLLGLCLTAQPYMPSTTVYSWSRWSKHQDPSPDTSCACRSGSPSSYPSQDMCTITLAYQEARHNVPVAKMLVRFPWRRW